MDASPELWTRAQASAADQCTIAVGLASAVLMERAALACVVVIEEIRASREVHVLCGPGNNGADGVAIARILHARGVPVQLHVLATRHGEALTQQHAIAAALGVPVCATLPTLTRSVVVVDAMLGTGAAPPLREPYAAAVAWANAADATRVAVDLPTGIDADTGAVPGAALKADVTVTFQRSKPGLHLTPARAWVGRVVVADIGLLSPGTGASPMLLGPAQVRAWLADLRPGAHKGERGHLAILGGSAGTPGAAVLAGTAALRGGAGLVSIISDDAAVQAQLIRYRPELMVTPRTDPLLPAAA